MNVSRYLAPLFAVLAIACSDTALEGKVITHTVPGRVCLVPESEVLDFTLDATQARTYADGARVKAVVDMNVCLSSSCDVERMQACNIMVAGAELTVSSTVSWRSTGADACTADCGRPRPMCTSQPLAAGTYTLKYKGLSTTFTVPSDVAPPCVGDPADTNN